MTWIHDILLLTAQDLKILYRIAPGHIPRRGVELIFLTPGTVRTRRETRRTTLHFLPRRAG